MKTKHKSLRSLDTGPLIDLHINIPEDVLNMLDTMKDHYHASRSVIIRELVIAAFAKEKL